MVGAIQSATTGMARASQAGEAISLRVLRKTLDLELSVAQQLVSMAAQSRIYDANAQVIETSERMLDIVV